VGSEVAQAEMWSVVYEYRVGQVGGLRAGCVGGGLRAADSPGISGTRRSLHAGRAPGGPEVQGLRGGPEHWMLNPES